MSYINENIFRYIVIYKNDKILSNVRRAIVIE